VEEMDRNGETGLQLLQKPGGLGQKDPLDKFIGYKVGDTRRSAYYEKTLKTSVWGSISRRAGSCISRIVWIVWKLD
jgi:hypothetical protein